MPLFWRVFVYIHWPAWALVHTSGFVTSGPFLQVFWKVDFICKKNIHWCKLCLPEASHSSHTHCFHLLLILFHLSASHVLPPLRSMFVLGSMMLVSDTVIKTAVGFPFSHRNIQTEGRRHSDGGPFPINWRAAPAVVWSTFWPMTSQSGPMSQPLYDCWPNMRRGGWKNTKMPPDSGVFASTVNFARKTLLLTSTVLYWPP